MGEDREYTGFWGIQGIFRVGGEQGILGVWGRNENILGLREDKEYSGFGGGQGIFGGRSIK